VKRGRKDRRDISDLDYIARQGFHDEAKSQRCCQMCGTTRWPWHAHHVVYEQHLKKAGAAIWCNSNSMRLCEDCHRRHHNRSQVIPLAKLHDQHITYAFDVLGLAADFYLKQRYAGEDERVEQALSKAEEEDAPGTRTL
jgi:hypothetical protein